MTPVQRDATPAQRDALESENAFLWSRFSDHVPTRTRSDLPVLQRALDALRIDLTSERDRRALGIALGMVLAQELRLKWVQLDDPWGAELALTRPGSHLTTHPMSMIEKRALDQREIDLAQLFTATERLFSVEAAPSHALENGPPCAWRAHFDVRHPGLDALEHRLGTLAATLHAAAGHTNVVLRGMSFVVQVDRENATAISSPSGFSFEDVAAKGLPLHFNFAGERALLVLVGPHVGDLGKDGPMRDLHRDTRIEMAKAIEDHLAAHPEQDHVFPHLDDDAIDRLLGGST